MVSFGSRTGAAGAGATPLMIMAFLTAAGFMYWLSVRAAPVEVGVVDGDAVVEEDLATVVTREVFGTDPMAQADMLIQVPGLLVQGPVGTSTLAFFVQVPNQAGSYLIKMLSDEVTDGEVVATGSTITMTGQVRAMSNPDSVADSWIASGAIVEGDRILLLVSEGGSFFEAEAVDVTGVPRPDNN